MLRLNALGCLTVFGESGPMSGAAAQPRRLAILALLARAGERGITRDKVAAILWPDADDERARSTLSKTLYTVRRDLGSEDVIVGTKDLRLNPEIITTDVAEFERAIAEGEYEKASAIYRGPFLDGFRLPGAAEFDRWVDTERAALRHDYEVVLETLARRSSEQGDYIAAARWWRMLAALDPFNGRHALGLMRAMEAAGDRAGAIQHARIYDTLVHEELDLPPDPEVVAFARQLRETPVSTERAKPAREPTVRPTTAAVLEPIPQFDPRPMAAPTVNTSVEAITL